MGKQNSKGGKFTVPKGLMGKIDRLVAIAPQLKGLQDESKELKAEIIAAARKYSTDRMDANDGFVKIGATSATELEPDELLDHLKSIGQEDRFTELVKVKITDTKNAIGKEVVEDIGFVTYEPYGKVTVKSY